MTAPTRSRSATPRPPLRAPSRRRSPMPTKRSILPCPSRRRRRRCGRVPRRPAVFRRAARGSAVGRVARVSVRRTFPRSGWLRSTPTSSRGSSCCHPSGPRSSPAAPRRLRLDFPPGETSVASAGDEAGAVAGAGAVGAGGAAGAGEAMPPRGAANAPSRVSGRSAAVVVAGVAGDGVVGVGEQEGARRTAASGDCPATSSSRARRCPSPRRRRFRHRRPKARRPSRTTQGARASHSGPR